MMPPDKDGYPTEDELNTIKHWDILKDGVEELLKYMNSLWHFGGWGFNLKNEEKKLYLVLHTGGWSGNEDIVVALRENIMFWPLYWEKSTRGGHHYFEIESPANAQGEGE
jgi:hypothetical protein